MGKVFLLLDEPSNCGDCKLQEDGVCFWLKRAVDINSLHAECPLRKLPDRERLPELHETEYSLGWKAYHDAMLNSIFTSLFIRDPVKAFENAMKRGMKNPNDYMYMESESGFDVFKHHVTRKSISYPYLNFAERFKLRIINHWQRRK